MGGVFGEVYEPSGGCNYRVEEIMKEAEKMTGEDVQNEDWAQITDEQVELSEEMIKEMSAKLNGILMDLTTGEANVAVRRC